MRLLDTPYSQSGLIDINLARLSMNPNDKIAQKRYAESEERKKLRKNVPEHDELWYGCQPFYNLNKMKAQYLRNRYICPDIIKKTREENMKREWFEAKESLSTAKTARDLSLEFGCRTGDCRSCSDLQEYCKTKTDENKTGYRNVKTKMLNSLGVKVKRAGGGGCCGS